jgi:hypothetical protein
MEGRKEKRGNERQEEEEWGRDGGEEIRAFVCCDTTLTRANPGRQVEELRRRSRGSLLEEV